MIDLIKWLIFLEILGWLVFPLTFNLFKGLADKGFSISKILGLLLWGYIYWLGNTFQILNNDLSSVLLVLLILSTISVIFIWKKSIEEIKNWCKLNLKIIIFYEVLFLIIFLGWAIVRAANPEIIGTEKPMELTFINGIFRSPSFPPNDPWLSNYSISYYYFGYLLVSMIMRIAGTESGVGFNLAISAWFALVAVSSSGILFNLLVFRREQKPENKTILKLLALSLIAPLMILIVSNGEGLLEVLHARGFFWSLDSNNQLVSPFWKWMDIKELSDPPAIPFRWIPGREGGTWWWRASRVLQDYTLNGQSREIIDEFPFFSFLLADLHPHVLSMPFVLLVIYSGFSKFISNNLYDIKNSSIFKYFQQPQLWLSGLILGVLIFVNTWDFPIYFGFIVLIYAVQRIQESSINKYIIKDIIFYSIALGFISILIYIPFLLGLSSQASGFLPSLIFRTRGIHFLIMFLPQILLIFWFLLISCKGLISIKMFTKTLLICTLASFLFLLLSFLYALLPDITMKFYSFVISLIGISPQQKLIDIQNAKMNFLNIFGADSINNLISETIRRFLASPYLVLLMVLFITFCVTDIFRQRKDKTKEFNQLDSNVSIHFVKVLVLIGALLCFFPEFFYLRDQFGWRMNTIFKFYFQAWIVFSLAAAYAIVEIINKVKTVSWKILTIFIIALIIGTGFIYPLFAIQDKTNAFHDLELSLDGNKYFSNSNPLEAEAISFLNNEPYGVISEAIGGSYSNYGRISEFTGLPTILGWPGHESQWRGGTKEIDNRESDISDLYTTSNWDSAKAILNKYSIRYIYIGQIEKSTYHVWEKKFSNNLIEVFKNNDISIYEYSPKNQ